MDWRYKLASRVTLFLGILLYGSLSLIFYLLKMDVIYYLSLGLFFFIGFWCVFHSTMFLFGILDKEFIVKEYHSYSANSQAWEWLLGKKEAKKFTREVVNSGLGTFLDIVLFLLGLFFIGYGLMVVFS